MDFGKLVFLMFWGAGKRRATQKHKKMIVDEKLDRRGSQGEEIIIQGVPLSSGSGHFA
jgi:hypothetical protein